MDPNGLSSGFIKKISPPLVKPLCVLFLCLRVVKYQTIGVLQTLFLCLRKTALQSVVIIGPSR